MKKVIAFLLAASLLFCLFGCGKETTQTVVKGKVYYLNFKPEQDTQWKELAELYKKQTGVNVDIITAASGTYEETLKSEMAKSNAPTLFQVNGPVGLASWKNYCEDLSDTAVFRNLKSEDFALEEDGKVLAVAYVIESYGIIYNKDIIRRYCKTDGAVIKEAKEIDNFEKLKAVAEDMQKKKDELGITGAFASAGMDSSSDWRFKTQLANIPLYYEFKDEEISEASEIQGTYLKNYKNIWDLYIHNSTVAPSLLSSKTGDDAAGEFALGKACFYQNGTWAYNDIKDNAVKDEDIGMLPIYTGIEGEEKQGLCTGSENYWCINKNASSEDKKATERFLEWVITSNYGRRMMAEEMKFTTPFKTFDEEYESDSPLVKAANEYINSDKFSVSWVFTTIPSAKWKDNVGDALLEYAQGTGAWSSVEKAFVDGWKTEYAEAHK